MKLVNVLLLIIVIGLMVACGNQPTPDIEATVQAALQATLTAQPTNTPPPTDTPTPAATNTPPPTPTKTTAPTKTPTQTPTPYKPYLSGIEPLGCSKDDFQDITFCTKYNTSDIENYVKEEGSDTLTDVAVYVGQSKDDLVLRWDIVYSGDDWIFIDNIVFLTDDNRYSLPVDQYQNISTDILDSGWVVESYDRNVDSLDILADIVTSNEVKIRLSGKGGNVDKTLTPREINIILRALATYEQLGGHLPDKNYQF